MKDSQLSDFPTAFVGTFPNLFLLRSWARHSPGTELFRYITRLKNQLRYTSTSYYLHHPYIQVEKLNTPE